MKAQTEHKKNIQKSANLGMETFLNLQKQTIENTFSMLDQGIATQEDNLAKTRTIVKEWENNLNQLWGCQKEELKSIAMKFSEALWPESKKQVEQVEKFYQDNFGGTANKTLEMLEIEEQDECLIILTDSKFELLEILERIDEWGEVEV